MSTSNKKCHYDDRSESLLNFETSDHTESVENVQVTDSCKVQKSETNSDLNLGAYRQSTSLQCNPCSMRDKTFSNLYCVALILMSIILSGSAQNYQASQGFNSQPSQYGSGFQTGAYQGLTNPSYSLPSSSFNAQQNQPFNQQTASSQQPMPQPLMSQQPMPQQTMPQQHMPQQLISQQPMPQQTMPQQHMHQHLMSQQPMPQQTIPQQPMPQQPMPQQFMSQQSMPQQPMPQQFMSQRSMPQDAMSQQSMPDQSFDQTSQLGPAMYEALVQDIINKMAMYSDDVNRARAQAINLLKKLGKNQPLLKRIPDFSSHDFNLGYSAAADDISENLNLDKSQEPVAIISPKVKPEITVTAPKTPAEVEGPPKPISVRPARVRQAKPGAVGDAETTGSARKSSRSSRKSDPVLIAVNGR